MIMIINNIILIIVIMVVAVTMVRILMTGMNLILSTTCIPPPPFSSSSLSLVPLQLMDEIGQDPLQGTKGILMMGMMMINGGLVIVKGSETTTTSAVTATTSTAGSISTGRLLQIGQGMLNQGMFPTSRWSRHQKKRSLLSWWVTTTSTATTNSISTMDVTVPTAVTNCSNNVDANPLQFVCSDPLNHVRHGPYRPLPQW